jgi:hypothetical protein
MTGLAIWDANSLAYTFKAGGIAQTLAKGPHVAETFPVHIEDSYVIVET